MCDIEQCARCRKNFDTCGHYDHTDTQPCEHYVKPIDNTKMFAHWYSFKGRIGRKEYILTFAIVAFLYAAIVWCNLNGYFQTLSEGNLVLQRIFALLPIVPMYLLLAANVKRAHDAGVSVWWAFVALLTPFFGVFSLILDVIALIYLFKFESEDGINKYGTNPTLDYEEQIAL